MPRIWDDIIPEEDRQSYDKGRYGVATGFGARPAVLVVDMSHAFVDDRYPLASEAVGRPVAQATTSSRSTTRGTRRTGRRSSGWWPTSPSCRARCSGASS
jgi:hypothetical protein